MSMNTAAVDILLLNIALVILGISLFSFRMDHALNTQFSCFVRNITQRSYVTPSLYCWSVTSLRLSGIVFIEPYSRYGLHNAAVPLSVRVAQPFLRHNTLN
jgi:hypothetical protein